MSLQDQLSNILACTCNIYTVHTAHKIYMCGMTSVDTNYEIVWQIFKYLLYTKSCLNNYYDYITDVCLF